VSGSRKYIYKWAKATRGKLDKLSEENGWTESERAHEERLLSDFMKATKTGDETAAKQAWEDMRPETQHDIEIQQRSLKVGQDVSAAASASANDLRANSAISTSLGADVLEEAALAESASSVAAKPAKETGLLNPPDVKLTEEFTSAASDKPAGSVAEQQIQLAAVAAAPKAATPVLSQEFSI
jgi:hypothetical protein